MKRSLRTPKPPIRRAAILDARHLPFSDPDAARDAVDSLAWFLSKSPAERLVVIMRARALFPTIDHLCGTSFSKKP